MGTMTDTTRDMCYEQAQSTKQLLEEVWEAIDAGEEYEGQDAREYLDEWPLEVVWEKGEPFAVVLGTGGPHVEITGGGRQGAYTLWVYWGGDKSAASGAAITRTGDYFRELYEELGD
jgi:acetylornithine deacetylase/succinyl-diaminopimelate desuccinylase-like protein